MEPDPGAGEPAPGQPQTRPESLQDRKRWACLGLAVVAAVLIAAASLPVLLGEPEEETPGPISGTVTSTAVVPRPSSLATTARPTVGRTPAQEPTPLPATTGTTPARTCIPAGQPGFTVTVSPVQASAARGEAVTYHMTIEDQNCFSEKISMKLTASVLFFLSNTYDLGTQEPPYPKTFEYILTVPDSLFPGATVNGVLTSTGGGITRENHLVLNVE